MLRYLRYIFILIISTLVLPSFIFAHQNESKTFQTHSPNWLESSHQVSVFSKDDFNQTTNIQWASNLKVTSFSATNKSSDLNKSSSLDLKPTIFLLSGGAFKNLDNETELNPDNHTIADSLKLANKLASLGFNVFWIEYETAPQDTASMIDKLFDIKSENCFYTNGSESKALFEYSSLVAFRDVRVKIKEIINNPENQIDTNNIFISGISAGAFLSIYYLFLDKEEIPQNISYKKCNDETEYVIKVPEKVRLDGFPLPEIKGIFALAGGSLYENIFLNNTAKTSKVAIGFMHGTCDEVINQKEGRLPYKYFSVLPFSIEYNQSDIDRFPYAYGSNYIFDKIKKTHKNISYGQVVNGGHIIIGPTPIAVDMTGGWDQYTTNNSTSILNQRDIVFDELSSFINIQIGTKSQGNHNAVNYAVLPDNTTSLCLEDDLLLIKSPILISDTLCPNSVETAILNDKFPNFTKSVQWEVSSNLKIIGSSNEDKLVFEVGSKNSIDTIFVTIVFNNNVKISTYKTVVVGKNNTSYSISSKAFPQNAGAVSKDSTYKQCQLATVKANPSAGYEFVGWTEYGHDVSTDSIYHFSVTKERFLIANFKAKTYEVQLQSLPTNGGIVYGAGTYNYEQIAQVSAQVKGGFSFKNWTENGIVVSTDSVYSFIVNRDRILIANFEIKKFEVNLTASPSEGGILLGEGLYEAGQSVRIEAQVADGFSFKNWTEEGKVVSANRIYNFKISDDHNLVANFVGKEYKITLNASPTDGGILSGGGKFFYGDTATVLAKPRVRFSFKNWTENGVIVSTDSAYSFKVTGDKILIANFVTREFNINVLASPQEGGTLTGGGMYEVGASVSISAQAAEGYIFKNWTENGKVISTNKVMNFKATSDRTLIANFIPQEFNIDISASPTEGGTLSGAGNYNYNESATVTAYASVGFKFLNWTENGTVVSTDSAYSFKVTGDKILIANFVTREFNIDISASPTEGGTLSGAGKYNYNESATVTASASVGFEFLNWTENGTVVSTDRVYQFTVTEDKSLIANFNSIVTHLPTEKLQSISIYPNPFIDELIIDSKDLKMIKISIYNVIGEKVIEENISNLSQYIVKTTNLSAGTYIIVVDGEKERYIIEGVKL